MHGFPSLSVLLLNVFVFHLEFHLLTGWITQVWGAMIISYDYELCFIGLVILWIHHCNCTAACGHLCRLVVHCENSSSCLKFAFAQTFVKEA